MAEKALKISLDLSIDAISPLFKSREFCFFVLFFII